MLSRRAGQSGEIEHASAGGSGGLIVRGGPHPAFSAILAAAGAVAIAFWVWAIFLSQSFVYVEGDVTTWITLFRRHRFDELYRSVIGAAYLRTNYPPLYLAAVAALAPSEALIPETGRIVSLFGALSGLALIARLLQEATGKLWTGLRAAALLGLAMRTTHEVSACYPDAMAFGVAVAGSYLVSRRVRGWPIWAPICFAVSCFIKHSLIVFPLGILAWAVLSRRERKNGLAAGFLLASLIGVPLLWFGLWEPLVLQSAGRWDLRLFLKSMLYFVVPLGLGLFIAVSVLLRHREIPPELRRLVGPWAGVFLCGVPWLLAMGRIGSSPNYMYELQAAVAVLVAIAWHLGWWPRLLSLHVLIVVMEAAGWLLAVVMWILPAQRAAQEAAAALLQETAAASAPRPPVVIADPSWLAIRNGFEPLVMPFLAGQQELKRPGEIAPLYDTLRNGKIDLILISCMDTGPDCRDLRLPEAMWPIVEQRYKVVLSTGALRAFRPR